MQGERELMRLYTLLHLSNLQKQQLASRWKSWNRRRTALSSRLAAAQNTLHENLPSCSSLASHLRTVTSVLHPECESDCEDSNSGDRLKKNMHAQTCEVKDSKAKVQELGITHT